jgi:hypothetical protein
MTSAELISVTKGSLPAWSSFFFNDTPMRGARFSNCLERSYFLSESRYRIRHRLSKQALSTGCYKATWIERFIPALTYAPPINNNCAEYTGGGASITSIEVLFSAGFTSTPTLTISSPGNGGTTATATATIDTTPGAPTFGQITGISIINSGSRYLAAPTVSFSGGGGGGATYMVHLGTETEKSYTWSGVVPPDYDDDDMDTWPTSDVFSLVLPEAYGSISAAPAKFVSSIPGTPRRNVRFSCYDCD